jgi:hypothetical protein
VGSRHATGIYITHNPVDPDLLARANNRIQHKAKQTTTDSDIVGLAHLTLDFDPMRKSGIPSTDIELGQALAQREAFIQFVTAELGWPEPVVSMMSGNGGQATWRIDLPVDEPSITLVHAVLAAASALFSTPIVSVDTTLGNSSRIVKLSGTVAAKGDALPHRPHRRSVSDFCPETGVVSEAQLRALVSLAPEPKSHPRSGNGRSPNTGTSDGSYDIPALLTAAGVSYREHDKSWARVYGLDRCLSSDDHTDGAAILQFPSGAVAYHCFHNRCAGITWHDVKPRLDISLQQSGSGAVNSARGQTEPNRHPAYAGETVMARPAPGSIVSAADLVEKTFPEPRWAVPSILPEGASLLVGAPKKGKSWLLLSLGIAIASGGFALGKIPVECGDVLLLCLEDSERRLQERLVRILDGEPAPERLHVVTEWPRLDEGGAEALDAWLMDHPETRLVGIDVLARLRPPSREKNDLYQRDYETGAAFKRVADKHGVPLVVVHHSRKAAADDPLDLISGTTGLAAAVDTALILMRAKGEADANLYVRGRDVLEADHALSFDPVTCQWSLLGDAQAYQLTPGRAEVLRLVREHGPSGPKEIAEALGVNRGAMRALLMRMKNAGEILTSDGLYYAPPGEVVTGVTGVTPPENHHSDADFSVTPFVTSPGGVTPPVTAKAAQPRQVLAPVTPVTPEVGHANGPALEADPWADAVRVVL